MACAFALGGCKPAANKNHGETDTYDVVDRFIVDRDNYEAVSKFISEATKVEVFRISQDPNVSPPVHKIDGYSVSAKGKDQGNVFAKKVHDAYFDGLGPFKGCIFSPAVVFRVWSGSKNLDLLLCFQCNESLLVAANGFEAQRPFDSARSKFVKLAKEAFPDDKEIQALEGKRK